MFFDNLVTFLFFVSNEIFQFFDFLQNLKKLKTLRFFDEKNMGQQIL